MIDELNAGSRDPCVMSEQDSVANAERVASDAVHEAVKKHARSTVTASGQAQRHLSLAPDIIAVDK